MRASINQTGRTRIPVDALSIELISPFILKFNWFFENINFDSALEAVLELTSLGNLERVTIPASSLITPGNLEISLEKFADPKSVVGRMKIVTRSPEGLRLITSESKTLRLENDKLEGEHGKSLLDVYWDPNLRTPWQLVFEDSEPLLKVSNFHDNATKIYSHTVFQTSILPEVLRQIAFWLLTEDPDESQNIKVVYWWTLIEELGLSQEDRAYFSGISEKNLEILNEIMDKCQELADQFSLKHNILQKMSNAIHEEEQ
ncbi:hypothetical protein MCERE85_00512 [Candidatus Nanopelagicaceae bacterium]